MSIRVVARIRPQQKEELEKDVILSINKTEHVVKIPNPKKESELYCFQFSKCYDHNDSQQDVFEGESELCIVSTPSERRLTVHYSIADPQAPFWRL